MLGSFKKVVTSVCIGLSFASLTHAADIFPDRMVKIIVPYTPGGFNDTLGRTVGDRLGKLWNQPVVVENRPGGNTVVANNLVAKSPPDGYTMLVTPLPFSALPGLYGAKLPYNALKDFQPLVLAGATQNVLAVRSDLPVSNVKELLAYAKANPGKLNFGSTGYGSSNHLSMELLMKMTGTKLTHVPYKGSAPAVMSILAGEIDVLFDNVPNLLQHVKAGKVKAIAVSGSGRTPLLPSLPTVAEAGVPGYEVNVWFGMQVPAGTPKPLVERVNKEIVQLLKQPDVVKIFRDQGVEVIGSTPDEFSKTLHTEVAKWNDVIREAKITID